MPAILALFVPAPIKPNEIIAACRKINKDVRYQKKGMTS
jgi:hypothetical protein